MAVRGIDKKYFGFKSLSGVSVDEWGRETYHEGQGIDKKITEVASPFEI